MEGEAHNLYAIQAMPKMRKTTEESMIQPILDEIRERAAKATPGKWFADIGDSHGGLKEDGQWYVNTPVTDKESGEETESVVCRMSWPTAKAKADADFIAHSRTDVPRLLAALEHSRETSRLLAEMMTGGIPALHMRREAELGLILSGEKEVM